jgi:GAG-pre-integrase domain
VHSIAEHANSPSPSPSHDPLPPSAPPTVHDTDFSGGDPGFTRSLTGNTTYNEDVTYDLDLDPDFDASLRCFSCSDLTFAHGQFPIGHESVNLDTAAPFPVPSDHHAPSFHTHSVDDSTPSPEGPIAQIDGGSQATTTGERHYLWSYRPYSGDYTLTDAGGRKHHPTGTGYLKIPTTTGHHFAPCYYTPTLPTIISPAHLTRRPEMQSYTIACFPDCHSKSKLVLHHHARTSQNVTIPMITNGGITFSYPLLLPTDAQHMQCALPTGAAYQCRALSSTAIDAPTLSVHTLNRDAQRILWHNQLGHIHHRRISELHKHVQGIPKIDMPNELEQCPTCLLAKARRSARSTDDSRRATICNQGISVDFGFIIQQSTDSKRYNQYKGLHGQTCYVLVADHYSGMLYGKTFKTKAPPIIWLNGWLATHAPVCPDKYVRLDQGGDLARCREVTNLFRNAGYRVEITGAGDSAQNGPVERPHQTIAAGIRALLLGADLELTFWPYAFHHFLRLYNITPHAGRKVTPHELQYGEPPDLSRLRTFGCRVYVYPPGKRSAKLATHVDRGIFLGYQQTMQNILYFDLSTKQVKVNTHARFDEGMNDLPTLPPNAEYLLR